MRAAIGHHPGRCPGERGGDPRDRIADDLGPEGGQRLFPGPQLRPRRPDSGARGGRDARHGRAPPAGNERLRTFPARPRRRRGPRRGACRRVPLVGNLLSVARRRLHRWHEFLPPPCHRVRARPLSRPASEGLGLRLLRGLREPRLEAPRQGPQPVGAHHAGADALQPGSSSSAPGCGTMPAPVSGPRRKPAGWSTCSSSTMPTPCVRPAERSAPRSPARSERPPRAWS